MSFDIQSEQLEENQKTELLDNLDVNKMFIGGGEINAKINENLVKNAIPTEYDDKPLINQILEKFNSMAQKVDPAHANNITDRLKYILNNAAPEGENDTRKIDDRCDGVLFNLNGSEELRTILDTYNKRTNFSDVSDPTFQAVNIVINNIDKQANKMKLLEQQLQTNEFTKETDSISGSIEGFLSDKSIHIQRCNEENITPFPTEEQKQKINEVFQNQQGFAAPLKNRINQIDEAINKLNPNSEEMKQAGKLVTLEENRDKILEIGKQFLAFRENTLSGHGMAADRMLRVANTNKDQLLGSAPDKPTRDLLENALKQFKGIRNREEFETKKAGFNAALEETAKGVSPEAKENAAKLKELLAAKTTLQNAMQDLADKCTKLKNGRNDMANTLQQRQNNIQQRFQQRTELKNEAQNSLNIDSHMQEFVKRAKDMQKALQAQTRAGHINTREFKAMSTALDNFVKDPSGADNAQKLAETANAYLAEKQKRKFSFTTAQREHRLTCAANIASLGKDCADLLQNVNRMGNRISQADNNLVAKNNSFATRNQALESGDKTNFNSILENFNMNMNFTKEKAMKQTDNVNAIINPQVQKQKTDTKVI